MTFSNCDLWIININISLKLVRNAILEPYSTSEGFPRGSAGKESAYNVGDLSSIPGLGRSPGEGKGYLLQYSGLENSMERIVCGVTKSWTWLRDFHLTSLLMHCRWILYHLSYERSPAMPLGSIAGTAAHSSGNNVIEAYKLGGHDSAWRFRYMLYHSPSKQCLVLCPSLHFPLTE